MENITYGKGYIYYSVLEKTYYEIVKGCISTEKSIFGYDYNCSRPKRLYVQKMKFLNNKTELIPIDDCKNKEFSF